MAVTGPGEVTPYLERGLGKGLLSGPVVGCACTSVDFTSEELPSNFVINNGSKLIISFQ